MTAKTEQELRLPRESVTARRKPSIDPDERIYVIGDIHGRHDLLNELLGLVENHSAALPPVSSIHVVVLGDMVDRGPDSAKVLDFLYSIQQKSDRIIVLLGNHEQMMLQALEGQPEAIRAWLRIGGDETLRSFGIEPPDRRSGDVTAILPLIRSVIPREWLDWIKRLPLTARSGDYLFCHAGIRPGTPIKRQARADLLWIRDEFLYDDTSHGVVVVHGHSISSEVEIRHNRVGIDTGAYKTGVLTALYLEGTAREILSTGGGAVKDGDTVVSTARIDSGDLDLR